jgi:hypothetical protein
MGMEEYVKHVEEYVERCSREIVRRYRWLSIEKAREICLRVLGVH